MDAPVCQGCRELQAKLAALEAKVQEQAQFIIELARKLQDKDLPKSGTPSDQPKGAKPAAKKPSGRKAGGQPGHPPHFKQMLPPERVTKTVAIIPERCEHCQHALPAKPGAGVGTDALSGRPAGLKATIIEYQGTRTCRCCGGDLAKIPTNPPSIGPDGCMSYLVGVCGEQM